MELKVTRFDVDAVGVATLWLDRPGRGNSWTARMHDEIRWICSQLDADPAVRVIVFRGAGEMFCAGADFKALNRFVDSDYDPSLRDDAANPGYGVRPEFDGDMVWQLGLRTPLIAAVNGGCAGIAVALVAFCDFRIAIDDAKITTVAPRLGLPAEYGLSWALPRLIGVTHSADLLLTGRIVRAAEMRDWGFFNAVVAREDFDAEIDRWTQYLVAASPDAIAAAKRQMWGDLLDNDPRRSVETSKQLIGAHMKGADYVEAISAMSEKRPPRFGVT